MEKMIGYGVRLGRNFFLFDGFLATCLCVTRLSAHGKLRVCARHYAWNRMCIVILINVLN